MLLNARVRIPVAQNSQLADRVKSISGGYKKNMKAVADLQRIEVMEADGKGRVMHSNESIHYA